MACQTQAPAPSTAACRRVSPTGLMPVTGRTSCWPSFGTSSAAGATLPVSAAGVAYGADGRSKLTVGSTAADALSRGEAPGAAGSDGRALVERLVRGCGARLESRCAVPERARARDGRCCCRRRAPTHRLVLGRRGRCSPASSTVRALGRAGCRARRSRRSRSPRHVPRVSRCHRPRTHSCCLRGRQTAHPTRGGATHGGRTGCSRMKGGDGRTGGGATITVIPSAGSLLASSSAPRRRPSPVLPCAAA